MFTVDRMTTVDTAAAAKHAERAFRQSAAVAGAGDAPSHERERRFAYVLARRVIAA
jgi:hypothetical protein